MGTFMYVCQIEMITKSNGIHTLLNAMKVICLTFVLYINIGRLVKVKTSLFYGNLASNVEGVRVYRLASWNLSSGGIWPKVAVSFMLSRTKGSIYIKAAAPFEAY